MMAEPRYGYNTAGQWTILQPGEAEWDPTKALATLYGNDTTSLLGQYYQAGGNFSNTGGLLSSAGAAPTNSSTADIVYNYTRPLNEAEQTKNINDQSAWRSMYMSSPFWNPSDSNAYAIQNEPVSGTRNNVSDQSKWNNWATNNKYIKPVSNGSGTLGNGINVVNNSSSPVRVGGGLINNSVFPTNSSAYKPENILQPGTSTNNQTTSSTNTPYLSRMNDNMAYSGAPRYNDVSQVNDNQTNTGLTEATKMSRLGTEQRRSNTDFSKALWR